MSISYKPLFETLHAKNMNISELRKVIHPTVIAKINRGTYITLQRIEDICRYLDVPIEDVVRIE